jgi:hypothetical protein
MALVGKTRFPNGGANDRAILDSFYQFGRPVGNIIYVSSTLGSSTGPGWSPNNAYATIDQAVGACTANNGDVIVVLPGHAEVVSAAGGLDLDVAGITVLGIGVGSEQPTVTLDTAITADVDVDAAGVTVENIHFRANFADITAAIDVNADDFTLRRCRLTELATNMNALIWVQDAAAGGSDRITIEDCYCVARDAANTHFVNFAGTGDGHKVVRNTLMGDWGTMCIGGAGVVTNCLVLDNLIDNTATTNDACINFAATATGIVARNLCGGGAAQANGVTATAMAINQNYYGVSSEDLSGILDPIAT